MNEFIRKAANVFIIKAQHWDVERGAYWEEFPVTEETLTYETALNKFPVSLFYKFLIFGENMNTKGSILERLCNS